MMKETMTRSGGAQQASSNTDQVSLLRKPMEQYATNPLTDAKYKVNSTIEEQSEHIGHYLTLHPLSLLF